MKLADLLARELESWPDCVSIVQDYDGEIGTYEIDNPFLVDGDQNRNVWHHNGHIRNINLTGCIVASDAATAIITRAQWQSARDKLKGETKVPKANKDGWIRHRGGKCPVAIGETVELRHREGKRTIHVVCDTDEADEVWEHVGDEDDIMAYRIHAPEQAISDDAVIDLCVVCADDEMPAATLDNPLAWRDRIKEIDTTVEALEDERSALIQRLADEGLALLRVDGKPMPSEPIKAEDSAQGDMGDWRNWRAGDQIEHVEGGWADFTKGRLYTVTEVGEDYVSTHDDVEPRNLDVDETYIFSDGRFPAFKWHHRP